MAISIRNARREECSRVIELITELAIFEKAPKEMILTTETLEKDAFAVNSIVDILVACLDGKIIGTALYYEKYSTWKGRCIYLEDLIVSKKYRGMGAGKLLFEAVIKEAKSRNSGRMEWQVLDWNKPAIDFYKNYKADIDPEWLNGRFTNEYLQQSNF